MYDNYGYLIHSAKGSTWSKGDHKYISKKKVNGKWVYYYKLTDKKEQEQLAKNREYQAKILKGQTGGVVNANHKKSVGEFEADRERHARADHVETTYGENTTRKKNNAKKYTNNVSTNSGNGGSGRSMPFDAIPDLNDSWADFQIKRRKEHAAQKEENNKRLNSKSYQMKNKIEGIKKTVKNRR